VQGKEGGYERRRVGERALVENVKGGDVEIEAFNETAPGMKQPEKRSRVTM
jgi:hypothetical protein